MNRAGRVVAVVVTYNRLDQLQKTLARLLEAAPADLAQVVVVDNASTDGTQAWLATQSDARLDVLRSARNLGGAGGFETGMRHAAAQHAPDWILVMDDDARPQPSALAQFQATAPADAWAVAGAVFHPDGRICDINRPSINPFWHARIFWRTALGGGRDAFHLSAVAFDADAPTRDVDAASFVGLFVARAGWETAGFPDSSLFIYGDDVLYTLGLRQAGGRIVFDPAVRFEHDFTTLTGGVQRFAPLWKVYYHHRNLMMVYRRAAGVFFWPALLVILPKWLSKARHYGAEAPVFRTLLRRAIWHGLRQRTDTPHDTVLGWCATDKT